MIKVDFEVERAIYGRRNGVNQADVKIAGGGIVGCVSRRHADGNTDTDLGACSGGLKKNGVCITVIRGVPNGKKVRIVIFRFLTTLPAVPVTTAIPMPALAKVQLLVPW